MSDSTPRDQHGNPIAIGRKALDPPAVSRATAAFLLDLLNRQQLAVGAPDFDQAVQAVLKARAELAAIIEQNAPESNA